MFSSSRRLRRLVSVVATAPLALAPALTLVPSAQADTAPAEPDTPTTVSADALPTAQINGVAWAQVTVGNTVYVAGKFTNVRPAGAAAGVSTTTRNNLMAYDIRTGALVTSFAPDLNAQALTIAASPDGSRIYVGGDFTVANGQSRSRIAAYSTATGQLISTFKPSASTQVKTIVATNSTVYFGGNFRSVSGVARGFAAAASASTGAILPWAPEADNQVGAMTLNPSGSKLVIGGRFQYLRDQATYGLGAVDPVTGEKVRWDVSADVRNAGPNSSITWLTADGDSVYGNGYHYGAGGNLEGTFRADGETGQTVWIEDCHGDTYSTFPSGDQLYTASHKHYCGNIGSFPETNPRSHHFAQAFSKKVTGTITHDTQGYYDWFGYPRPSYLHWDPKFVGGTFTGQSQAGWTVSGTSDYIAYGGEFPSVNGVAQQGLVRFAKPSLAPNKRGPSANDGLTPSVIATGSDAVRISWQSTFDQDNENLTYKVYRNFKSTSDTPVCTLTAKSSFFQRPQIGCYDRSVTPGARYNYRVYVSDAFGNTTSRAATFVDVPTSTQASPYADAVKADGPAAYYRLGEPSGSAIYDSIAFNDATAQSGVSRGAAGASGDGDTATSFNGTGDGYAVTGDTVPGPDTFTAEGWFKTTSTAGGKILGFGDNKTGTSNSYDRHVYLDGDGRVFFGVYPFGIRTLNTTPGFNDGQWHQVTASLGAGSMTLYVDGKKIGSRSDVPYGQPYSGQWRIGGDNLGGWPNQPASNFLAGDIDEVALYDKVLTRADVVDHYQASGRTLPGSTAPSDAYGAAVYAQDPDLYWRLDEASGQVANDSGPAQNPGNIISGVTLGRDGALKGQTRTAAGFNGNDGHVVANQPTSNPRTYSESIWFKTTTDRGGKLIGFGCAPSGTSGCYDRHVYMQDNGQLVFGVWTGQTNTITTPNALNDGTWHQVVAMQDTIDGMKMYVDGELVGTNPQTDVQPYDGWWRIGGDNTWGSSSAFFDGTLDEAAVFSKTLSASTVKTLYDLGAGTQPANVKPTAAFSSTTDALKASFDSSGSADSDGSIASRSWSFGDGGTSTEVKPDHTYGSAGTFDVTLTVTDDKGLTDSVTKQVTVARANVKPTAAFSSTTDALKASFDSSGSVDSDGSIVSRSWTFGDGATSTEVSPERTYAAGGTYDVTLTVTDDKGATDSVTKQVTVAKANEKPTAAFSSTTDGLKASFDSSGSADSDGSIVSRSWTFGDDATSTQVNPERTYAAGGTYDVTLTVTDDKGATDSVTKQVTVAAAPAPSTLAKDDFARTLATGWGNAETGGPYTLTGSASRFEVGNGVGVMKVPAGSSPGAHLAGAASTSSDTQVDVSFDKAVTGNGAYVSLTGRGDYSNAYRARMRVLANGAITVTLHRLVNGASTDLVTNTVSGVTYAAGDTLRIRLQVTGTSPTTLRAKVWKVGSAEPDAWRVTATDSTASLQAAGGVGLMSFLSGSSTTTPLAFRYSRFLARPVE